jgi:hypothetical protein
LPLAVIKIPVVMDPSTDAGLELTLILPHAVKSCALIGCGDFNHGKTFRATRFGRPSKKFSKVEIP